MSREGGCGLIATWEDTVLPGQVTLLQDCTQTFYSGCTAEKPQLHSQRNAQSESGASDLFPDKAVTGQTVSHLPTTQIYAEVLTFDL